MPKFTAEPVGTVMIDTNHQPIYNPGNATIILLDKTSKIDNKQSYMLETAAYTNLPSHVVVNCNYVTPKPGHVSVILFNTISRNIWIRQPLLAANIYEVEWHPWQYGKIWMKRGMTLKEVQLVVPPEVENNLQSNQEEAELKPEVSGNQKPLTKYLNSC